MKNKKVWNEALGIWLRRKQSFTEVHLMQLKKKDFSPQNIFQIWHYFRFLVYKRDYKSTDVSLSSGCASRGVIKMGWIQKNHFKTTIDSPCKNNGPVFETTWQVLYLNPCLFRLVDTLVTELFRICTLSRMNHKLSYMNLRIDIIL